MKQEKIIETVERTIDYDKFNEFVGLQEVEGQLLPFVTETNVTVRKDVQDATKHWNEKWKGFVDFHVEYSNYAYGSIYNLYTTFLAKQRYFIEIELRKREKKQEMINALKWYWKVLYYYGELPFTIVAAVVTFIGGIYLLAIPSDTAVIFGKILLLLFVVQMTGIGVSKNSKTLTNINKH